MSERAFTVLKWAVALAAALIFASLTVGWCGPGAELHLAAAWLGLAEDPEWQFPLWGMLVRLVGKDIRLLGLVSANAAFLCLALATSTGGELVTQAIVKSRQRENGERTRCGHPVFIASITMFLLACAFAFTPGFLRASTRISPVMVSLVPPFAVIALTVRVLVSSCGGWRERLKRHVSEIALLVALTAYSTFELCRSPRLVSLLVLPPLATYLLIGVGPALVILWRIRRGRLVHFRSLCMVYGGWALTIGLMAIVALATFDYGWTAHRILTRVVSNAKNYRAVEASGQLADYLLFALPRNMRVFDVDRANVSMHGRDRSVLTLERYFPTRAAWCDACDLLVEVVADDPQDGFIRSLLAQCGNGLGCELLDKGDEEGAAEVFWTILDKIDPHNYSALVNLTELAQRDGGISQVRLDVARIRRKSIEARLKTSDDLRTAVQIGGRVYSDAAPESRSSPGVDESGAADALTGHGRQLKVEGLAQEALPDLAWGGWAVAIFPADVALRLFPALVIVLVVLWRKWPTLFVMRPEPDEHRHFSSDSEYWKSLGVSTGIDGDDPPSAIRRRTADSSFGQSAKKAKWAEERAMTHTCARDPNASASSERDQRRKEHERLSETAFADGHFVEAYFWAFKAKTEGSRAMTRMMAKCCGAWIRNGRHGERENVTERFTADRGSFARAALRIQSRTSVQESRNRIEVLAKRGLREAKQYLAQRGT